MRVAFDTNRVWLGRGSARTYLDALLPALLDTARADDTVIVVRTADGPAPDALAFLLRRSNLEATEINVRGKRHDLWRRVQRPSVQSLARGLESVDIFHSVTPPLLPTRAGTRIATVHALGLPQNAAALARSLRRADCVIVPAEGTAAILSERHGIAADRLRVIRPGVAAQYLEPPKPAIMEELCTRFPFLQEPYVLTIGASADPDTGAPFLIDAHGEARAIDPTLPPLVVVAPRGGTEAVARLIEEGGRQGAVFTIEDLGRQELPALYRGAEFVLEPASTGAFGQSLLEAAACGIPALAHAECGALEMVQAGAITPTPGTTGWARAMADLHQERDTRARLGLSARRATADWTWERAAREHWQLYDEIH